MKVGPKDARAFDKMRAGALTSMGFLGQDDRPPEEIIAEDETAFSRLGLDFDSVADWLAALAEEGGRGLGEPITLGTLLVQSGDARGMLPCPWEDGLFHKNAVSAWPADMPAEACAEGEDRLVFSDLSIHLLRAHHFCQGKGSPFRLEPETLARFFRS
ncbi:MAG TPA: hypothetical protein VIO60_07920 [Rectinemataceae bacterium]